MLQVVRAIVPKIILDDVFTVSTTVPGLLFYVCKGIDYQLYEGTPQNGQVETCRVKEHLSPRRPRLR